MTAHVNVADDGSIRIVRMNRPDKKNAMNPQLHEDMTAALEELPEAQREVVLLRHFHGWSLHEIGLHVGRSPPAVAGLLHRGLQGLRARLQQGE